MEAVITGLGSVCSLGRGVGALWEGIAAGRDGIAAIARFSTEGIKAKLAGMVPDRNDAASGRLSGTRLNVEFATEAAREAMSGAGIPDAVASPSRIALVLGTSLGEPDVPLFRMTEEVARALGIEGPALTVSTACTSSTNALGLGLDLLRSGTADAVVAGGSDVLTPIMLAGFNALGVLSEGKCAPFSHPFGTTLGEGAGFCVLESRDHAERRGARVRGVLAGYGLSGDAYHETSPEPTGSGVARAISGALGQAALAPAQIRYVNAHGTGTVANDPAEWRAIRTVFGEAADRLPVSSTKSYLGHAQGAAGILEAIATLISMEHGVVPPTLHFRTARKNGPSDPVAAAVPRAHDYRYAVCSNSAFGGANAAVVVARSDTRPETASAPVPRREIRIGGVGVVGAHGLGAGGLLSAVEAGRPLNRGRVADFSLGEAAPGVDPRGLDASSRFVTAAAAQALDDAGLGLRRTRRDRIGLIMGVNRISRESVDALDASIARNGLPLLSANAFSRMVLNAPVGSCSKLLALGGPLSTISTGEGSGLAALIYAAELLGSRSDADALVAGGLDEAGPPDGIADPGEGAACAVLSNRPFPGSAAIVAAGWGLAGRNGLRTAAARALAAAAASEGDIEALFGTGLGDYLPALPRIGPEHALGYGEAFSSAAALVAAVLWLREGRGSRVMVANGCGGSATAALVLVRKG